MDTSSQTSVEILARCEQWLELYNSDVHRMIDEFYPDQFLLAVAGIVEIDDKDYFHKFESAFLAASPVRKTRTVRLFAGGNDAALELELYGETTDGTSWSVPLCELLTFDEGLIVRDVIYLDPSKLPHIEAPAR